MHCIKNFVCFFKNKPKTFKLILRQFRNNAFSKYHLPIFFYYCSFNAFFMLFIFRYYFMGAFRFCRISKTAQAETFAEISRKRGGWGRTPPPTPFFGFFFVNGIMESTTFECTLFYSLSSLYEL